MANDTPSTAVNSPNDRRSPAHGSTGASAGPVPAGWTAGARMLTVSLAHRPVGVRHDGHRATIVHPPSQVPPTVRRGASPPAGPRCLAVRAVGPVLRHR